MRPALFAAILGLGMMTASAWGETSPLSRPATIVLLVRHAEKAAQPEDDPPLTLDGRRRVEALVTALKDAHLTAVITTQLRRSIETGQPAAAAAGVAPETIAIDPATIPQHVTAVAAAVRRHAGETVLVVGHNNTVPAVIAALGGPSLPPICEMVFDRMLVLVLAEQVHLVQLRYGDPSPQTAACD